MVLIGQISGLGFPPVVNRKELRLPCRILVVEDNLINQKVAMLMLQRAGFRNLDLACDGDEAVQACTLNEYDLVLMDCQMPKMDGLEATRQIRNLSKRQPSIIGLTAHVLKGHRKECLSSGMNDVVTKPYTAEQLVSVVRANVFYTPAAW